MDKPQLLVHYRSDMKYDGVLVVKGGDRTSDLREPLPASTRATLSVTDLIKSLIKITQTAVRYRSECRKLREELELIQPDVENIELQVLETRKHDPDAKLQDLAMVEGWLEKLREALQLACSQVHKCSTASKLVSISNGHSLSMKITAQRMEIKKLAEQRKEHQLLLISMLKWDESKYHEGPSDWQKWDDEKNNSLHPDEFTKSSKGLQFFPGSSSPAVFDLHSRESSAGDGTPLPLNVLQHWGSSKLSAPRAFIKFQGTNSYTSCIVLQRSPAYALPRPLQHLGSSDQLLAPRAFIKFPGTHFGPLRTVNLQKDRPAYGEGEARTVHRNQPSRQVSSDNIQLTDSSALCNIPEPELEESGNSLSALSELQHSSLYSNPITSHLYCSSNESQEVGDQHDFVHSSSAPSLLDAVDNKGESLIPNIHGGKQSKDEVTIDVMSSFHQTNQQSLIAIVSDVFKLTSDETFIKVLHDEFIKVDYISELLSGDYNSTHKLSESSDTTLLFYFNEQDNIFEYYFRDYISMACTLGVGLEYAKVLLEDGWQLKVKETSKHDWEHAWKSYDSMPNTMKVTIREPHVECVDSVEDFPKTPACIPRGRSLLMDIARYFILKSTIASLLQKGTVINYANNSCVESPSSSSSSSFQGTNQDSTSTRAGIGNKFFQTLKNIFISTNVFNQGNTKVDGTPEDLPSNHGPGDNTTVYLELLPGGCLSHTTHLDDELRTLASQLDNTIFSEMKFTFIKEDNRKEIHITVGPISFQLREEDEENYMTIGRFGWFHKSLDASFGVVNAACARLCSNEALDVKEVKQTYTTGCTDAVTNGTAKTVNALVGGKVPQVFKVILSGSNRMSTDISVSNSAGYTLEEVIKCTEGGFSICPKPNLTTSKLRYTYLPRDYMSELDHGKLSDEEHRKKVGCLPICIPQTVRFQGTWQPNDVGNDPHELVEYTFEASRVVEMTSKKSVKVASRCRRWRYRRGKKQVESGSNYPLKFTQKHSRNVFLNHSMTHLDGRVYKVKERLNQVGSETYLTQEFSLNPPSWSGNPLVELNQTHVASSVI